MRALRRGIALAAMSAAAVCAVQLTARGAVTQVTTGTQTPAQAQVFRAGVEVVTADVLVLDKSGQLVTDLEPSDFIVIADKRPRRVISADYLSARTSRVPLTSRSMAPARVDPPPPAPSTNLHTSSGRSFVFAVDEDEIRAGDGRAAIARLSDYLDTLGPDDRVGLVALPTGTPRVDLTTDRVVVQKALGLIAGMSTRYRDSAMTPGEAEGIFQGDTGALTAYLERNNLQAPDPSAGTHDCGSAGGGHFVQVTRVSDGCKQAADMVLDQYRLHTRQALDTLGALATAMGPIPGPKTLVLVSEGLMTDLKTFGFVQDFAERAEKARVALYAIHLDAPMMEASIAGGGNTLSRSLDDRIGFDGMGEVAAAARGEAIRAVATPDAALRQIDTETSGYYLIAFERDINDTDGKREKIDVKVNRPGVEVRARAEFTPGLEKAAATSITPPADVKDAMGTLLHWPVAIGELPLVVDSFAVPGSDATAATHVLVVTEISDYGRPLLGAGFEVTDAAGKIAADTFDAPPVVTRLDATRSSYAVSVPLPPGHFRLKIGAIDADGRRGSVEHSFDVPSWPAGLRVGDVMFGESASTGFRPIARVPAGAATLGVVVEVRADAAVDLQHATATLRLMKIGTPEPLATQAVTLTPTNDPLRVLAAATLKIGAMPSGAYLAIVTVHQPSHADIGRLRVFAK